MMTFDASEHPRATDGTFSEKTGTSPEVALDPTPLYRRIEQYRGTLGAVAYGADRDWKLRDEVLAGYQGGKRHMYDHHYAAMWAGHAVNVLGGHDGWSETEIRNRLSNIRTLQDALAADQAVPSDFTDPQSASGTEWTKEDINKWLEALVSELEKGLETEGRSLVVNARDARQRYADFEGGGNLR